LMIFHPRETKERFTHVISGLLWSLVPLIIIAGYPIVFSLRGPEHVAGSAFHPSLIDYLSTNLLSPIVPTSHQLLGSSYFKSIGNSLIPSHSENGAYIGIPFLVISLLLVIFSKKQRAVRYLGLMALVAFVFSLGPSLYIDHHHSGIWMPFSIIQRTPLLSFGVPSRYFLFTFLCLSILLCLGLANIYEKLTLIITARKKDTGLFEKSTPVIAIIAITVIALLPMLPSLPYYSAPVVTPKYFLTNSVDKIPNGSTVLAYPYPIAEQNFSMLWQIRSGFRFNLLGGYVLTPFLNPKGSNGSEDGGFGPRILNPATIPQVLFEQAYGGPPTSGPNVIPPLPWAFDELKAFIENYHVNVIIADRIGVDPGYAINFLTKGLGIKPEHFGKIDLWLNVGKSPLMRP